MPRFAIEKNTDTVAPEDRASLHLADLPRSVREILRQHPALAEVVAGFAARDPLTFMHCVGVNEIVLHLIQDLHSLGHVDTSVTQELIKRSKWVLFHDFGKIMASADVDPVRSHHIVYPNHMTNRPHIEMGLHWVHPILSALLLQQSLLLHDKRTKPPLSHWIPHIANHHYLLRKFIQKEFPNPASTSRIDAVVQYLFRIADIAVAMRFPRNNQPKMQSIETIKTIVRAESGIALPEMLQALNAPVAPLNILDYITAATAQALSHLEALYPSQVWRGQVPIRIEPFSPDRAHDLLLTHIRVLWEKNAHFWMQYIVTMDDQGIFSQAKARY